LMPLSKLVPDVAPVPVSSTRPTIFTFWANAKELREIAATSAVCVNLFIYSSSNEMKANVIYLISLEN